MMEDAWDWVQEEIKKMQDDIPVDSDAMQVVDAISVADFWKRRYDEERMLWERKLDTKEDEKRNLKDKAVTLESSIKQLDWRFKELERRWEQEKLLLEDRLKSKELESAMEKRQMEWDARLQTLEQENRALKMNMGAAEGIAVAPYQGGIPPAPVARQSDPRMHEREDALRRSEEEARLRLEELEREKQSVQSVMGEKEKALFAEREKWGKLEKELTQLSGQMSQQLDNLKDREEEHFVILEDLARGFAHRVRNYLGIISGTMQLSLVNFKMEPELEEQLKVVDQNVQDMLQSIEEFLSLARIPEMNYQQVNFNQMLDAVTQSVIGRLGAASVTVKRSFATDLPGFKCDPKLCEDALRHLVENAIEAMMPQGGTLELTTALDTSRNVLLIKIADTGSGITENHVKKVFQPYFTSKKTHRGLGLTIAKRVIDLHRGTLALESAKGKGTTITINLFLDIAA